MLIADTLYRAHLEESLPSEKVKSLELVDHTENVRVSPSRLACIEQECIQDPVCSRLRQAILQGWPCDIRDCDPLFSRVTKDLC